MISRLVCSAGVTEPVYSRRYWPSSVYLISFTVEKNMSIYILYSVVIVTVLKK